MFGGTIKHQLNTWTIHSTGNEKLRRMCQYLHEEPATLWWSFLLIEVYETEHIVFGCAKQGVTGFRDLIDLTYSPCACRSLTLFFGCLQSQTLNSRYSLRHRGSSCFDCFLFIPRINTPNYLRNADNCKLQFGNHFLPGIQLLRK